MYCYPWDLLDEAPQQLAARLRGLELESVTLAMAYHAGKFMRPHAASGKVVFPEDGVVYFDPDPALYGTIRPVAHSDPRQRSLANELAADIPVRAWLVLLHNSRLGAAHPEFVTSNAWGDPYLYSLCPSQPAVREYAVALCRDAARNSVRELVLETPGWLPYAHGYHHEFAQVRSNQWLDALMGLCFCKACRARAATVDIDADSLAQWVRSRVDAYLDSGVDAEPDQAAAWLAADLLAVPELAAFIAMRNDVVLDLIREVRAELPSRQALWVIPTVQRPTAAAWLEGSDLAGLAQAANGIEVPFYETAASRVAADAWDVRQRVPDKAKVRAILRPGPPDLAGGRELPEALSALAQSAISGVGFYNYGLLRRDRLEQMALAVEAHNRKFS